MRTLIPGLCALLLTVSAARAQGEEPKILYVDLQKVIFNCDEYHALVAAGKKAQVAKQKEFDERVTALKEREKALLETTLNDRTAEWFDKLKAAQKEQADLIAERNYINALMADKITRKINSLMTGAQQESRKIMKERGAYMVLVTKTGRITLDSETQLQEEVVMRRVLCAVDSANITNEVLKRMNDWYAKHRSSTGEVGDREPAPEKKEG